MKFSMLFSFVLASLFLVTGLIDGKVFAVTDMQEDKNSMLISEGANVDEAGMERLYAGNEQNEGDEGNEGVEGQEQGDGTEDDKSENQPTNEPSTALPSQSDDMKDFARRGDGDLSKSAIDNTQASDRGPASVDEEEGAIEDSTTSVEEKSSRWGFYAEFWQEGQMDFKVRGLTEIYLRPQYKLTDDLTVGFSFIARSQWATWDTPDDDNPAKTQVHDPYFMLSSGFDMGPTSIFGYVRLYLPVSEDSRKLGQVFRIRIKPYITLPIFKEINLVGRLETNYYQHSVDSRVDPANYTDYTCTSVFTCPDYNVHWRIDPLIGFNGRISGPWSFESIHGVRIQKNFSNENAVASGGNREENKPYQLFWYHESGLMFDIPNTPITLLAGFGQAGEEVKGSGFAKSIPIVSYFTNPSKSFWVLNAWMTL